MRLVTVMAASVLLGAATHAVDSRFVEIESDAGRGDSLQLYAGTGDLGTSGNRLNATATVALTATATMIMEDGSPAPPSPRGHGALRYNDVARGFEVSVDGGPWTPLAARDDRQLFYCFCGALDGALIGFFVAHFFFVFVRRKKIKALLAWRRARKQSTGSGPYRGESK